MNSFFQYTIEVSVGLIMFYGIYYWLLRNEACLNYKRIYLLATPILSLVLPILKLPSFSNDTTLSYSFDFVSVSAIASFSEAQEPAPWNVWDFVGLIYLIGAAVLLLGFILKLTRLFVLLWGTQFPKLKRNGFYLRPTQGALPSFTFFNHLFLDNLNTTESDQSVVLEHEQVHIRQKHSFDVIFMELLKIFLWFNPVSWWYTKALQITHESIADAHAVDKIGLEKYMEVLASISLPTPYHKLVHHFNVHSTLNRIAMLKQLNRKVSFWKYLLVLPVLVSLILLQACQEDVGEGINSLTENGYEINTDEFTLFVTKNADDIVEKGKPEQRNISHHKINNNQVTVRRWQGQWTFEVRNLEMTYSSFPTAVLASINLPDVDYSLEKNRQTLTNEINQMAKNISAPQDQIAPDEDGIFSLVDEPPHPIGGMNAFYQYIAENLRYPDQARTMGIEGKVYVTFVVDTDGSLTDMKVLKGIGAGCDDAAIQAMKNVEPWAPGKRKGEAVKVRMQMPIVFKLN